MFTDIEKKLKGVAIVNLIFGIVIALACLVIMEEDGILIASAAVLTSLISSWFIYAFAELLENKGLFMENGITKWICLNCGYVWEGDGVPEKCPVCYHGKGYFIRLDESPFER